MERIATNTRESDPVIVALLTTQVESATTLVDHILQDWAAAGLKQPSAFRAFLGTYVVGQVHVSGRLSERDWNEVQAKVALAVSATP